MQQFTLSVPCKLYIRKYFTCIYGEKIPLDHTSDFGITVLTMMAASPLIRVKKNTLNLARQFNTDQVKFVLPADFFYRINTLSEQQQFSINRYLENIFQADLFRMVNVGSFFGVERRLAIETFSRRFNIVLEEDVTYEALKRAEYRNRKAGTARDIFLVSMSSPFTPAA